MLKESAIESKVVAAAAAMGVRSIKLKSRAWPDRLFFIPGGRPLFIEFKKPGEKLRKNQLLMQFNLRSDGYDAQDHNDAQEAIEAIKASCAESGFKKKPSAALKTAAIAVLLRKKL